MGQYTFSADLVNDILFRAGEPTDGTSDFEAAALRYLNRAYQIVWMGGGEFDPSIQEEWWWLRKARPGILTLEPKISAGTVRVTNNSASITFSAAPSPKIDASLASGWFFRVTDHPDIFRILTHTSGSTAATLDSRYTGPTATAKSYTAFKLQYPLATDVMRPISPMRVYQDSRDEIEGRDLVAMERDWPLRLVEGGVPRVFAPVAERVVRFSHLGGASGTKLIRVEYEYLRQPADLTNSGSEEPLVPRQFRRVLSDLGAFLLFEDKNDTRSVKAAALARTGLQAMSREHRRRMVAWSRTNAQILPRPARLPQHLDPVRTESGMILG